MFVIAFLASDADPLNVATDELIVWSVDVSEALISAIAIVDEPLILVTIISLAAEAEALKPVSILSAISCLAVDADELNSVCDVETDALKLDMGKVDEPLILATNTFLASEAEPLNVATDELIAWSVVVNDSLTSVNDPLTSLDKAFLAADDDPLRLTFINSN